MNHDEIEYYDDPGIASKDTPIPKWLKCVYATLPFWGIAVLVLYWNGSQGWLDRGYWQQLQTAANTTEPPVNWVEIESNRLREKRQLNVKSSTENSKTESH